MLEAAWCLTNMAAAEHEVAEAVLTAGPLFVALLGGGWGPLLAWQCAWAIGVLLPDSLCMMCLLQTVLQLSCGVSPESLAACTSHMVGMHSSTCTSQDCHGDPGWTSSRLPLGGAVPAA